LIGFLCLTTAAVALVEHTVRAREALAISMENAIDEQARSQNQVLAKQREARRLSALVQWLDPAGQPPVAELFARYLSAQTPPPLRFSEVQIQRGSNGWSFVLHGFVQDQPGGGLPVLERFENELEQGVFRAHLLGSTRRQMLGAGDASGATPPAPAKNGARGDEKPFFIAGEIR
jgi:hypothetical protein